MKTIATAIITAPKIPHKRYFHSFGSGFDIAAGASMFAADATADVSAIVKMSSAVMVFPLSMTFIRRV